jgi:hypothetical protein
MRIAVFHQYYLAAGAPGGSRFNEFARLWCELGHGRLSWASYSNVIRQRPNGCVSKARQSRIGTVDG